MASTPYHRQPVHLDTYKATSSRSSWWRDPDRDSLPKSRPYAFLVPPTSPWNRLGRDMIGVHTHFGSVISPTLISPERYEWLYVAHSRLPQAEAFTQDLLKLLARYHPRAKSLNPLGRKLKLANHWANMPTL